VTWLLILQAMNMTYCSELFPEPSSSRDLPPETPAIETSGNFVRACDLMKGRFLPVQQFICHPGEIQPPTSAPSPRLWRSTATVAASRENVASALPTRSCPNNEPISRLIYQLPPSTFASCSFKYAPSPTSESPELRSLLRASSVPRI
jgi:hypothetical protein